MATVEVPMYAAADGQIVALGKLDPDYRSMAALPWLGSYVNLMGATPPPPKADFYSAPLAQQAIALVLGNDRQGDCTVADLIHSAYCAAAASGRELALPTEAEALGVYHAVGGPWDRGLVIESLLKYARDTGYTAGGLLHKIDGYVAVDFSNLTLLKIGIYLFGSIGLGVRLPGSWINSKVWDNGPRGFAGGHAIPAVGYDDAEQCFYVATWGGVRKLTYAAVQSGTYVDEAWIRLFPELFGQTSKLTAIGLDSPALRRDMDLIAAGQPPEIAPAPPSWLDISGGLL